MKKSITFRKITVEDSKLKVDWYNDFQTRCYMQHEDYQIPKTKKWIENLDFKERYEFIVELDNNPIGVVGMFNYDVANDYFGFYIVIGDPSMRGKGLGIDIINLFLDIYFSKTNHNGLYLYTNYNHPAQKNYKKVGFKRNEEKDKQVQYKGEEILKHYYYITRDMYERIRKSSTL